MDSALKVVERVDSISKVPEGMDSASTTSSIANKIKAVCAVATSACFAYGARSAWKQAKSLKPEELPKQNLMNGVGFAARALGLATLITVSGFGLMLLGISSAMNVNTPKQFGTKVTSTFGDRFQINRSTSGEDYSQELSKIFE